MKREAFEHAVRAAGAVLGVDEVLVIGSQALHASVEGHLPEEAERSVEVDVAVRGDTEFCSAVAEADMVDRDTLLSRLEELGDLDLRVREAVEHRIQAI